MEILYTSDLNVGLKNEAGEGKLSESAYLEKFKKNLTEIAQKNDWKHSGQNAQFLGQTQQSEDLQTEYQVHSVCPYTDGNLLYSVAAQSARTSVTAIIKKNSSDDTEQYLIHRDKEVIHAIDFDGGDKIAASLTDIGKVSRDIALFSVASNDFYRLTGGDSVDDNPYFSKCDGKILFDTRGIGRNAAMEIAGYSESMICAINENRAVEEIAAESGYDLFSAKNDAGGNLYYIKKPHQNKASGKSVGRMLLDVLLLPFWLIYGLIKILFFFAGVAQKSAKKGKNVSYGNNPYVEEQKSERELYIQNEKLDIEKEEQRNKRSGDKNPGFAPQKFELWRTSLSGEKTRLAKGVLDYDLTADQKIVFTNGRYVFLLDGEERKLLFGDKKIQRIRINGGEYRSGSSFDPFGAH